VIATSAQALRVRARELRYGLLLVPSVLAIALIALGIALSSAERHAGTRGFDLVFTGDAAAARSTLTVLGDGIATIVGISFSITIVALHLVSQQFSPRSLRNFLAERVTQVMAGFFVGTFGYALVVLRVVHGPTPSKDAFVPTASISVAILVGPRLGWPSSSGSFTTWSGQRFASMTPSASSAQTRVAQIGHRALGILLGDCSASDAIRPCPHSDRSGRGSVRRVTVLPPQPLSTPAGSDPRGAGWKTSSR
jgi:hypothetical protein